MVGSKRRLHPALPMEPDPSPKHRSLGLDVRFHNGTSSSGTSDLVTSNASLLPLQNNFIASIMFYRLLQPLLWIFLKEHCSLISLRAQIIRLRMHLREHLEPSCFWVAHVSTSRHTSQRYSPLNQLKSRQIDCQAEFRKVRSRTQR